MKPQSVSQLSEESGEVGKGKIEKKLLTSYTRPLTMKVWVPLLLCAIVLVALASAKVLNPCKILSFDQHVYYTLYRSADQRAKREM